MKTCSVCQQTKQLEQFHAHPTKSMGRDHRCKQCAKAERAALRQRELPSFRSRELKRWHARKSAATS